MSLKTSAWLAVAAFILVAVAGVLLRPMTPIDETRYVGVAWEMYLNGNFFVPTKNFVLYTDKPPLLFWLINLVWHVFGVSETAARLVSPFFALISLLLTAVLARRIWPEDTDIGARTVLTMTGLLIFSVLGGLTMFDMMLAVATLIGLLALTGVINTGLRRWWVLFGVALAFGVFAKGPVIFIHLGPALLLISVWAQDKTHIDRRQVLAGTGLALGVALVLVGFWLIPAVVIGGQEYRDAILWTQTAGRISESFAHKRPWWFFLMLMPLFLYPWIWTPAFWHNAAAARLDDRPLRLCLIWFGAAFMLFSMISGKQPHYLVPELPAFALIAARLTGDHQPFRLIVPTLPLFAVAVVVIAAVLGLAPMGDMETLLKPIGVPLAWALVVIALCLACIRIGGLRGTTILGLGLALSINLLIGLTDTRPIYSSHPIAEAIKPFKSQGIAFFGQPYNAEFNFAARITEPVATPESMPALQDWSRAHPGGVIVGRPDRADIPWPPYKTMLLRNALYAVWRVSDATDPEFKP